jgi:hypothetical protein
MFIVDRRLNPGSKSLSKRQPMPRVQNTAKCVAHKNQFCQPIQSDLGRPDCGAKINRFSFPPNQFPLRACAREALQGGLKLCLGAVSD